MGLLGVRGVKMNLSQLLLGGRSLGKVFLWVIMPGENYTSYTFLGSAGWACGKVFALFTFSARSLSQALFRSFFSLHSGDALGGTA